jgi:hypothetical protein
VLPVSSALASQLALWLAIGGIIASVVYVLVVGRYMATHYTRIPGGRWTTWERTVPKGRAPTLRPHAQTRTHGRGNLTIYGRWSIVRLPPDLEEPLETALASHLDEDRR